MHYRLFGHTGLRVSELSLGTMTFGSEWGWGADFEGCKQMLDCYQERGGNFIDTANFYTNGQSETFLGRLLKGRRHDVVLATKYTLTRNPQDPNASGNHRKSLVVSVEGSLERLQTDYIDVLWVHAEDIFTPVEEMMRALDDLVRAGKVLYVGVSDFPAWKIVQANMIAYFRDWTPFAGIQILYNLMERSSERELLPMAHNLGLAATIWSPLAGGALTGKYLEKMRQHSEGDRYHVADGLSSLLKVHEERNVRIVEHLVSIAQDLGHPPHQVALNWIRQKENLGVLIPIIGAKNREQLVDNLACLDFTLPQEVMEKLEDISQIALGFPHDFLKEVHSVVYGETLDRIQRAAHKGQHKGQHYDRFIK